MDKKSSKLIRDLLSEQANSGQEQVISTNLNPCSYHEPIPEQLQVQVPGIFGCTIDSSSKYCWERDCTFVLGEVW